MRYILPFLLIALCWGCQPHKASVIPYPQEITLQKGSFRLTESTPLYTNLQGQEKQDLAEYLQTLPAPFNGTLQVLHCHVRYMLQK